MRLFHGSRLFKYLFGLLLPFFYLYPLLASDQEFSDNQSSLSQEHWHQAHLPANEALEALNPTNLPEEFSKLHLNNSPHPELYHLYVREKEGAPYVLVKDSRSHTRRIVRLYGTSNQEAPHYVTRSVPSSSLYKEAYIYPPESKYKGSSTHPTGKSSSYPTGVSTYYIQINGKRIRLDQGHNIPYAATLKQRNPGLVSTKDPENYVPQNIKYNSPIRRDLEEQLYKKRLGYKEISIYHSNCMYDVSDCSGNKYRIPIPEGFIFLVFDNNNEITDSYYFPNLVDYEALKKDKPSYKHFPELYQIQNLAEWFLIPEVTLGLVEEHQQKVEHAQNLAEKTLLNAPEFFNRFSEEQMPPKARVALLATLLEWNVESAATLEFLTFTNQLQLAYYYLASRRSLWEIDDRTEAEKKLNLKQFTDDKEVSQTAHDLVEFLKEHLDFKSLQYQLQKVVIEFKEVYRNANFYWSMPEFYPKTQKLTVKNGDTFEYNLASITPQDILKFEKIIGGMRNYSIPKARYVLSIIDERARNTPSTIMDKLNLMRLYNDYEELINPQYHIYWEREILNYIRNDPGCTLIDRRRVVDYYSYRRMEHEKAFWLQQFVSYLERKPTFENFASVAEWCNNGRAAFLQSLEEQKNPCSVAKVLALQIYKGLNYKRPNVYRIHCTDLIHSLQEGMGLYQSDHSNIVTTDILHPRCLDPFLSGDTGEKLKQISYLFLRTLFPTNIAQLYSQIPEDEFVQILAKKSHDFREEAYIYNKLGLKEEAQKAAKSCFNLAHNSHELKEAALILQAVGMTQLAEKGAKKTYEKARTYEDFIYAVEAFTKLGKYKEVQEAKSMCFQEISRPQGSFIPALISANFISAAVEFYKLGLIDFAKEAAMENYNRAENSNDLTFAVHIFMQNGLMELAKEAAEYSDKIAKNDADRSCVAKNFEYIRREAARN